MLYPMFTLVMLIFIYSSYVLYLRVSSVKSGKVKARHFKYYEGDAPDNILATSRHFSNLFETPILFYVVGTLSIVLNADFGLMVYLGWMYVGLRIIHGYIHVSYNHILHRLSAFWASMMVLLAMWVLLIVRAG